MKLRASVPTLLLSFVVPALLTEAGLNTVPFCEPQSHAQPADAVTEVARQRYEEGVKAYDAGRFEEARTAFLQAYALKRHPAVLLNLGQSELRSNHPEDAGNHLQQFLREHKAATPEQRAAAEKGIAEAKRRTGFIIVIADANGADLSVDGSLVGKAPLLDPVFVTPGKHTVFASYQGKNATAQVDAKPGIAAAATLTLGTAGAAPVATATPAQTAPAPTTPPPLQPAAIPPAQPLPAAPPAYQPTAPTPAGFTFSSSQMGSMMGPDQSSRGREPLLRWYTRKPIAWAGTGIAVLGLGMGIIGSAVASNASGNADELGDKMREYINENPQSIPAGRAAQPCGPRDGATSALPDVPSLSAACTELRGQLDTYDSALPWAVTGWILFGVGVAGTATYAMIDWYPKKKRTADDGVRVTAFTPVAAPGQAGFGLAGTF